MAKTLHAITIEIVTSCRSSYLRRETRTRNIFAKRAEKAAVNEAHKCCGVRYSLELWLRYVEKLNCSSLLGLRSKGKFKENLAGRTLGLLEHLVKMLVDPMLDTTPGNHQETKQDKKQVCQLSQTNACVNSANRLYVQSITHKKG